MQRMVLAMAAIVVAAGASSPAASALTKLLRSGRLPLERQGTVIEMICSRGGADDLALVFQHAVAGEYDADLQRRILERLTDAAVTRKIRPSGDLSAIETILHNPKSPADVRLATIRLAAIWKVPAIVDELLTTVADDRADVALRAAAIDGLAAIGEARAKTSLQQAAANAVPTSLRPRSAAALARIDLAAAADAAAVTLPALTTIDEVGPLVDAFLTRKGGPERLAAALASQTLPPDAAKLALRHMYSVGRSDAALSDLLSKAAGISTDLKPPTPDELKQIVVEVTELGDAARGEKIFRRGDLSCLKCHAISRAGGGVGPDLSAVGSISPIDYVANSILDPNLAIKEQFVTRVITTVDGETFTGIIVDRDDTRVNLKDAAGKVVSIPTADVEEEAEGRSLMPQGLTKFLTRQELVDLIRFISELGKPGPYAIRKTPTIQRWRVLKQIPAEVSGDIPNVELLRQFVLTAPAEAWNPAYGMVAGSLPLGELGPPGSVVFLQGEVDVVVAGEISVVVDSKQPATLWLDAEPFDAASAATVRWDRGRHTLTLRTAVGDEKSSVRVELNKPPESKIQFDVVGGM